MSKGESAVLVAAYITVMILNSVVLVGCLVTKGAWAWQVLVLAALSFVLMLPVARELDRDERVEAD